MPVSAASSSVDLLTSVRTTVPSLGCAATTTVASTSTSPAEALAPSPGVKGWSVAEVEAARREGTESEDESAGERDVAAAWATP